jgi:phage terminase large subunit
MEIKATKVFEINYNALFDSDVRYIINEGGSRSSKTFSICQLLIIYALQNENKIISIVRKALTTVKKTVMTQDFIPMLKSMELYNTQVKHNKSDATFTFNNGTVITFIGADEEQKLRGMKHDIVWMNEANELLYDDFQQIAMRTTGKIILDYNPSSNSSFLYAIPEDKSIKIHSTYKDNPFLSKEQIDTIEGYKLTDINYYTIFALGKRANSKENVYQEWTVVKEKPEYLNDYIYAIDFGFTHPTALVKIWYSANPKINEIYLEEEIYESGLTSSDLVKRMNELNIDKIKVIPADYARPEIIMDMKRAGYKVVDAIKDVKDGINNVKTFKMLVNDFAVNIIKENSLYKYKKVNGEIVDDVIKLNDDAMDAIRYGVFYIKKYLINNTNGIKQIYSFNF